MPGAGSRTIADRLVGECVRFAQKKRKLLVLSASGHMNMAAYDDNADPLPKDVMRHGAMARRLTDDANADPGAEYDTQLGLDFLSHRLYERRRDNRAYADLQNRLSIRRGGRGLRQPVSAKDQVLLAEIIYDTAAEELAAAEKKKTQELPAPRASQHGVFLTAPCSGVPRR